MELIRGSMPPYPALLAQHVERRIAGKLDYRTEKKFMRYDAAYHSFMALFRNTEKEFGFFDSYFGELMRCGLVRDHLSIEKEVETHIRLKKESGGTEIFPYIHSWFLENGRIRNEGGKRPVDYGNALLEVIRFAGKQGLKFSDFYEIFEEGFKGIRFANALEFKKCALIMLRTQKEIGPDELGDVFLKKALPELQEAEKLTAEKFETIFSWHLEMHKRHAEQS